MRSRSAVSTGSSSRAVSAASRARSASLRDSERRNAGLSNCLSIIAAPFIRAYGRSRVPPSDASKKTCGSTSSASARLIVSASTPTTPTIQLLMTILARVPRPASPSQSVRLPRVSNSGSMRGRAASGPEAITTSWPFSAGSRVPSTGASMNSTPASPAARWHISVPSIPIVLICTHVAPGAIAESAAPALSSTATVSLSMVTSNSLSAAASRGSATTVTPSPSSGRARSSVRFQARISKPAPARFRAIGRPIVPVPRNASVVMVRAYPIWVSPSRMPTRNEITSAGLRQLAELRADGPVVLSAYLNLDPERFATAGARESEVRSLIDSGHRQIESADLDHAHREQVRGDLERVQDYLSGGDAPSGAHGLEVFSCSSLDLFEALSLPEPVESSISFDAGPLIAPLAEIGPSGHWCVTLVNRRVARIMRGSQDRLFSVAEIGDSIQGRRTRDGW